VHPEKSKYIVHTKYKLLTIKLGGRDLTRCGYGLQEEGVKVLGVLIDENLDWKLHINSIKKKIGKGNYLLWRYKSKLSINTKRTIYESFTYKNPPNLLPTCMGAKKSISLTELKKMIKKSWTKIGQRHQHTKSILKYLRILKLENKLKIAEIKIICRWEKKKIPYGLKLIIEERDNNNRRHRQFLCPIN